MWALLETLFLYLHRKKLTVPLIILGVIVALYLIIETTTHPVSPRKDNPSTVQDRPQIQKNADVHNKANDRKADTPSHGLPHRNKSNPIQDVSHNQEAIHNYTKFDELLREALNEKHGEVFSRNLSFRISQNLQAGKTDMETLDKTIMEELGEHGSESVKDEIRKTITEVLVEISKN